METLANENEVFKETWKDLEGKIKTTVRHFVVEHVVGCSFDDLLSLARLVMLRALRTYQIDQAKFNTYFYTCLKNAIRNNHRDAGFKREIFVVSYTDQEGNRTVWKRKFCSEDKALLCILQNNLTEAEIVCFDVRQKRIPVEHQGPLGPEICYRATEDNKPNIDYSLSKIAHYLPDRTDQEIVLAIYRGETFNNLCQRLEISYPEMKRRMFGIRRAIVRAGRDGVVLI